MKIRRNVPIPARQIIQFDWTALRPEIDCVEEGADTRKEAIRKAKNMANAARKYGVRVTTRTVKENGIWLARCWVRED